jgi:hypothetical protein
MKKKHIDGLCGEEEKEALKIVNKDKKQAVCRKCGEPIRSDEDSLCGNCI